MNTKSKDITIHIDVTDRRATYQEAPKALVCGNPFNIVFTFDEEWNDYADTPKKAKLVFWHRGKLESITKEFTGSTCSFSALFGITNLEVGVYIEDGICTTTGAQIPCDRSILCRDTASASFNPSSGPSTDNPSSGPSTDNIVSGGTSVTIDGMKVDTFPVDVYVKKQLDALKVVIDDENATQDEKIAAIEEVAQTLLELGLEPGLTKHTIQQSGTVSGARGYYWDYIDLVNKKIYLTHTQKVPTIGTENRTDVGFETPEYPVGGRLCLTNSVKYNHGISPNFPSATVTSVNHNVITYEGDVGFNAIETVAILSEADYSVFVIEAPHIGEVEIKHNTVSFGEFVAALGLYAAAFNTGTIALGDFSAAFGMETLAGYGAFSKGRNTKARGQYSETGGRDTEVNADYGKADGYKTTVDGTYGYAGGKESKVLKTLGFAFGNNVISNMQNQTVFGQYNIKDEDDKYAFILGWGFDGAPKNIFTIDTDGNADFAGNVTAKKLIATSAEFTGDALLRRLTAQALDVTGDSKLKNIYGSYVNITGAILTRGKEVATKEYADTKKSESIKYVDDNISPKLEELANSAKTVDRLAKKVDNLEAGTAADAFIVDDSIAYWKSVPEDAAPYAEIREIRGMTYLAEGMPADISVLVGDDDGYEIGIDEENEQVRVGVDPIQRYYDTSATFSEIFKYAEVGKTYAITYDVRGETGGGMFIGTLYAVTQPFVLTEAIYNSRITFYNDCIDTDAGLYAATAYFSNIKLTEIGGATRYAKVTEVVSMDIAGKVLGTLRIPSEVQALVGYGQTDYRIQWDASGKAWWVTPSGTRTDISQYFTEDNIIAVDSPGTIRILNAEMLDAPYTVVYRKRGF